MTWINPIQLQSIAHEVGTPFYAYSRDSLIYHWKCFDEAFATHPHQIHYAVKANSNLAVLQAFAELGSGFDIVSQGELARVLQANGSPQKIVFSGVGKTAEEIAYALRAGILCFNVESESEIDLLHQIASHLNVQAPLALRVNPDIDPNSHPYISTGLKESKFGIAMGDAVALYEKIRSLSHLRITGIACHIGSQITSVTPFREAFRTLIDLSKQLKERGIVLQHLNIGGGLGVRYFDETPPSVQEYTKQLLSLQPDPSMTLYCEPGRWLTASSGVLVTRVISLKKAGNKRFCIVDAGMNDFIRPALYHAWHEIISLALSQQNPAFLYDVVGPVCESGDFLGKDRLLSVQPGDLLAVCQTGAYGFVASSHYNSRPLPAEVMVSANAHKVVRHRETLEVLWALETLW